MQRGPGADIAPAGTHRHHDGVGGLLHHGVVDRIAGAALEGRLVHAQEIEIRLSRTLVRRLRGLENRRRMALELREIHAAP